MSWMIYGAYGYTGRLAVELALARGHRPTLAGRDVRQARTYRAKPRPSTRAT